MRLPAGLLGVAQLAPQSDLFPAAYVRWMLNTGLHDWWPDENHPGVLADHRLWHQHERNAREVTEFNNMRPRPHKEEMFLELWDAACDDVLVQIVRQMPGHVLMQGVHLQDPERWREWARQHPLWEVAVRKRRKTQRRHSNDKDMNKLVRKAVKQGAVVETGGKHLSLVGANGERVPIAASPSDHHAVQNAERQMIRKGILNPEQEGKQMAANGSYTLVKWPKQDLDRLTAVLKELGYERAQWQGRKGRGPGGMTRFVEHTMAVAEREGLRTWSSAKVGATGTRKALETGQTQDWSHTLIMTGVATMEEILTAPPPEIEEVGPAHGDGPKYECKLCGKKFENPSALGSHMFRTHKKKGESDSSKKRREAELPDEEKVEGLAPIEAKDEPSLQDAWAKGTSNGRVEFDADSLHLRVLRAILEPSANHDAAFALAAEVANLELRART